MQKIRTKSGNSRLELGPKFNEVHKRWYVVANRSEASIFRDRPDSRFSLVKNMTHEEGRRKEHDFSSDSPGRRMARSSGLTRHSLGKESVHHEKSAREFSSQIAGELESARAQGLMTELVVVAEPHFLGLIRASFSPAMQKMVKLEIHRDYCAKNTKDDLFKRIQREMKKSMNEYAVGNILLKQA